MGIYRLDDFFFMATDAFGGKLMSAKFFKPVLVSELETNHDRCSIVGAPYSWRAVWLASAIVEVSDGPFALSTLGLSALNANGETPLPKVSSS